jgi:hypothetical protein
MRMIAEFLRKKREFEPWEGQQDDTIAHMSIAFGPVV